MTDSGGKKTTCNLLVWYLSDVRTIFKGPILRITSDNRTLWNVDAAKQSYRVHSLFYCTKQKVKGLWFLHKLTYVHGVSNPDCSLYRFEIGKITTLRRLQSENYLRLRKRYTSFNTSRFRLLIWSKTFSRELERSHHLNN